MSLKKWPNRETKLLPNFRLLQKRRECCALKMDLDVFLRTRVDFLNNFDRLFLLTDKLHQETYLQTFEESIKSVTSFMNGP